LKDSSAPALIFFHGFSRSHHKHTHMAQRLARNLNMAIIVPDLPSLVAYALMGKSEEGCDNCISRATALFQKVQTWPGIDPNRIVLGGFSAGGAVAFEAAGKLQAESRQPLALALLDAVPWERTVQAAPQMKTQLEGGALLLESDPSEFNKNQAFKHNVVSAVPWNTEKDYFKVISVPNSKHVDCEDKADGDVAGVLDNLVWGTPSAEKTKIFQGLLEDFLDNAIHSKSPSSGGNLIAQDEAAVFG